MRQAETVDFGKEVSGVDQGTALRGLSAQPAQNARKRKLWMFGAILLVCDCLTWGLLYAGANFLRLVSFGSPAVVTISSVFIPLVCLICGIATIDGYHRRSVLSSLTYFSEHLLACAGGLIVGTLVLYVFASFDGTQQASRAVIWGSGTAFAPISLCCHRLVKHLFEGSAPLARFLVLGVNHHARDFYSYYRESHRPQILEFVGVGGQRAGERLDGPDSPLIHDKWEEKLDRVGEYDGLILAEDRCMLTDTLLERLVRIHFDDTPVYTLESFYEQFWRKVPVLSIDPSWALQHGFHLARNSAYGHVKRAIDVVFAAAALLLTGPFLLLIASVVKLESAGPAYFRQLRVGRNGALFLIFKFRTMRTGSETGDIYTKAGDSRITPLGSILRRTRLDELPQLLNVLRGEMSLIGPRAEWIKCAEQYEKKIPLYHFRHLVRPGITGWAQVNYPYGEGERDAIEKLNFDLYYIRHYSLVLDAAIVLKTLHVMLFAKGR